ncbi:hypothetical protein DYD21_12870 [Rhodohalobacter sp. SW132]|nr:hypothetical protein DYD21_12870 [Rhodohalobacter sp. SW132]
MACRGQTTDKPPISPQQNMQFQERFNAQQENPFFENNMAMRPPVEGTVSRGGLRHDTALFEGVNENGDYVTENPMDVTRSFMYRGKDRYDIFCATCHGATGDGQGIIMTGQYGYVPAPTFHRSASYEMTDGEIYSAIANGIRNMPAYNTQIKVEDRWAIVAYIRALQRSQNVPLDEIEEYDVDIAQLQAEYEEERARQEARAEAAAAAAGEEEVSAERGERHYTAYACHTCHSLDGTDLVGPTFAGLYNSERNLEDGTSVVADEEYLIESIVYPSEKIVEGYNDVMPAYDYLSESELQSLVEFIKAQSDN